MTSWRIFVAILATYAKVLTQLAPELIDLKVDVILASIAAPPAP